ncbi:MAG TPA: knotted carbamoyltransferase YgeW [Candidatus Krumholzibacteria bacterium]|nr:knotted carbamoyltransferase YgeW [Candidatus Krumholzibacteria bacterium]HPD73191.1 knotted carbamoyltransferase YgeW [Candidatus Krumholzibacteria bacterium]HRY41931.1 knotted carbamoyltransferase YgeW [Candidatus Krumholzibacteria bacterium]
MLEELNRLCDRVAGRRNGMHGQDFLLTWDRSLDDLHTVHDVADVLRQLRERNISCRCFDSGLAVSQFRDNSTRTRFSFASAANLLGLAVQDLDEGKSQLSHGETVRETAVMVSFLSEAIGIRDDMYLGAGHAYMLEVAAALDQACREGVLPSRPAIVNLQSDVDHPTQTMADLLHLAHEFGSVSQLRGRKIVMSWAYSPSYGKPLSVPQGVLGLMTRLGMEVVLAHPPGYDLIPSVLERAAAQSRQSGGSFRTTDDLADAFAGADIVYPKSWAPYAVMERRTELLRAGDRQGLADLERECLATNARFADWTCGRALMDTTREGRALYLHCLPADISGVSCEQGEVEAEVFEQYREPLYRQAGYKPYVIAAMILCSRFRDPAALLRNLARRAAPRLLG